MKRVSWAFLSSSAMLVSGLAIAEDQLEEFQDCDVCPVMVSVPAGKFTMGETKEEEIRHGMPEHQAGRSEPLREVVFERGFAIAKYPVTVAEFRTFVDETGYQASNSCFTSHIKDGHRVYEKLSGFTWRSPGFPQEDDHPVVCVNAYDGEAYAQWLSEKTGYDYSLPNEAQFEYAARAGTTTAFFWGDSRDATACEYSNQPDFDQAEEENAPSGPKYRFQCSDGYAWTSPVDTYKPNPWGLHDMLGNVWEWTADCWNDNYEGAPTDGSTWTTGDCDARSSRGGSYGNAAFSTYVGIRAPRHAGFVGHSWGFRLVRSSGN